MFFCKQFSHNTRWKTTDIDLVYFDPRYVYRYTRFEEFILFYFFVFFGFTVLYVCINIYCSVRPKKIKLPAWSEEQTEELHRIYDEMKTTIGKSTNQYYI